MKLIQISQNASDLARATAFYTELLGTGPAAEFPEPGLVFFDLEGTRLLLESGEPGGLLYLEVPDVRGALPLLRARGVKILREPGIIFRHTDSTLGPAGTDEWMAFIEDSEGNTVGLVSQLAPGPSE
ncbi:MAG TPA: VOC family protein [Micrococcaceae bacterium]